MKQDSEQKQMKGTTVIDIIRTIKSMKDRPWEQHLSEEAKQLVSQRILPSQWYPFEPALSCIWAVYNLVAGGRPELVKEWGKINSKRLIETIYKVPEKDTAAALKRLDIIANRNLVKGLTVEYVEVCPKHSQAKFADADPKTEVIYYFIQGWIEGVIELTGGKNGRTTITDKHWEGSKETVIDVVWE
ncbi:MAG: hypothetical protein A2V67_09750 [Deltaproteobacteria bacterium RBG_13_61_14]|nr:MAG: hypothetical protein A2V67_09750 [Deltaproteobacteria bacterium RBG_13_61_14]